MNGTSSESSQGEVLTAPEPKPKTPLDPPQIFYNLKWRVAPLIVHFQEDADALDPTEWSRALPDVGGTAQPLWPKLFVNINVRPVIVRNQDEARALGDSWQEFVIPEDLAQAVIAAAQSSG